MKSNQKKWIQLALLGVIMLISFSFLFVSANQGDQKQEKRLGVSSIANWKDIQFQDEQTEKEVEPNQTADKEVETNSSKEEKSQEPVEEKESSNQEATPSKPAEQQKEEAINQLDTKKYATISVDMRNILDHKEEVGEAYQAFIPSDGILVASVEVEIEDKESAYTLLKKVCEANGISLDASNGYVKYINNIGELDAGSSSGWLYKVNGVMPNVSSASYQLKEHDVVEWRYTVNAGDI